MPPATPPEATAALEHALVSRLKLRHLSLVLLLAQHRSLSRVARESGLSQPALTTALRQVEGIFGTPLFVRAPGGLVPTPAGEAVIGYARRSTAEVKATTKALASVAAGHSGRIRLGVAHGTTQALLTTAFTHLVVQERVAVATKEGTTDELVQALVDGEIDCALGRVYDGEPPGIVQHSLFTQEACLLTATRTAGRLARRPMTLAQFAPMDWILPPANTPMRRAYNSMFIAAGLVPPTPILETISRHGVAAVLQVSPNAIAILARPVADDLVIQGHCAILPFHLDVALPDIAFLTKDEMHTRPILVSLLEVLRGKGS